jgi:hypothetical protein
MGCAIV